MSDQNLELKLENVFELIEEEDNVLRYLGNNPDLKLSKNAELRLKRFKERIGDKIIRLNVNTPNSEMRIFADDPVKSDRIIECGKIEFHIDTFTIDALDRAKITYNEETNTFEVKYTVYKSSLEFNTCDINRESCGPNCC